MTLTFEERIDLLKKEYTDKLVAVDADRPELKRFEGYTGRVKTVNMSGRALVEFDDFNVNIGWFDIALDFLKVIDKPLPKIEKKAEPKAEKPAAKAPAAKAPAAAAPAGAKKLTPAEMIAQARAAKGGAPAAPAAPKAEKPASEKPAAPKGKLTPAEMIAAARAAKGGAPAAEVAPAIEKPVAEKPAPAAAPAEDAAPKAGPAAPPAGGWPKLATNAEKVAWCRANDNKG